MAQPKFTKRHYKFVAQSVAGSLDTLKFIFQNSEYEVAFTAVRTAMEDVSVRFKYDNPKFDEEKFMIVCGLEKGAKK